MEKLKLIVILSFFPIVLLAQNYSIRGNLVPVPGFPDSIGTPLLHWNYIFADHYYGLGTESRVDSAWKNLQIGTKKSNSDSTDATHGYTTLYENSLKIPWSDTGSTSNKLVNYWQLGAFVPYTGATANLNLSTFTISAANIGNVAAIKDSTRIAMDDKANTFTQNQKVNGNITLDTLNLNRANNTNGDFRIYSYGGDNGVSDSVWGFIGYRARGSSSSPKVDSANDEAAFFMGQGYDSSGTWRELADYSIRVMGSPRNGFIPGYLLMKTTSHTGTWGIRQLVTDTAGIFENRIVIQPDTAGFSFTELPLINTSTLIVGLHLQSYPLTAPAIQMDGNRHAAQIIFRETNGTYASPSTQLVSDNLGQLNWNGYDGTNYTGAVVAIDTRAEDNWTVSDHSAYLQIFGTPAGSITASEWARMIDGNFWLGTTSGDSLFTANGGIDVRGIKATGNANITGTITSGLINGQTISSAANFTGTATFGGDILASTGRVSLVSSSTAYLQEDGSNLYLLTVGTQNLYLGTHNTIRMTLYSGGGVNILGLPTSSAGLVTGDLWEDTTGGLNYIKMK